MDWEQYKAEAEKTALFLNEPDKWTSDMIHHYCWLGLIGELGELVNVEKKVIRGDKPREEFRELIKDELGDVFWYLSMLVEDLPFQEDPYKSKPRLTFLMTALATAIDNYNFSLFLGTSMKDIAINIEKYMQDWDLDHPEIWEHNINKLRERQKNGTLQGHKR